MRSARDRSRANQDGMLLRHGAAGLGYGQIFVLIFGFLISSGLIFLFGIWVGRDVAERRLAQEERIVRVPIPVQPTPAQVEQAPEEAKGEDVDVSFYQKLKEKAEQRLQATAAAAAATPARAARAPTPVRAAQAPTPTRRAPQLAEKPTPRPTAPPRAKTEEPPGPDSWADAGWTVQVNATTSVQQAVDLARTLKAKGYDAYTVQAPMRGQTWYRVRVGRFSSRDKAREMETRLKNDGMENAYVAPQ